MLLSSTRLLARSPIILLFVACLFSLLLLRSFPIAPSFPPFFSATEPVASSNLLETQRAFWRSFSPNLLQHGPQCEPIVHSEIGDLSIGYDPIEHHTQRPDRLNLSETQLLELRKTHSRFVEHLKEEDYELPVVKNTRGIVTTAGGKYLPVALVSIRMLRETGSTLPVEVFLASEDEWDHQICDNVFPRLNANCVVLARIVHASEQTKTLEIDKYQYKIMAMVFSSFEDILFLDADAFPIFDPAQYFDSEPFLSTGMIRWPDFWFPSESPLFFDVAGIAVPPIWAKSATESGELYYSKKKHTLSLLLALYYNYYGPTFYYPLQSQGAPGEGDKETFLWSAVVFNETFYSVKKQVSAVGYNTKDGQWRGSAMVQFDPVEDLKIQANTELNTADKQQAKVRPLIVHANFPKFNPASIFEDASFGASGPTKDSDGSFRRVWFDDLETSVNFFGFDLERRLWSVVRDIACEHEGTFSAWHGETQVCEKATAYWDAMYEQTK
jgi:alpha 1,2-mannosyltransferase